MEGMGECVNVDPLVTDAIDSQGPPFPIQKPLSDWSENILKGPAQ